MNWRFRAWDILSGKMRNLNDELSSIPFYELFCHTPDLRAMILMESSGLKDKNGKEIYEGDILSICNGSINGTPWMDKSYVVTRGLKQFDLPLFMWDRNGESCMNRTHWCEVIGNIHENKELIPEAWGKWVERRE